MHMARIVQQSLNKTILFLLSCVLCFWNIWSFYPLLLFLSLSFFFLFTLHVLSMVFASPETKFDHLKNKKIGFTVSELMFQPYFR